MKTDEYYQALEVCNNAKEYHDMDVMVARTYVRAFDEAIKFAEDYHKAKVNAITDEMIKEEIEKSIYSDDYYFSGYSDAIDWFKQELLKDE